MAESQAEITALLGTDDVALMALKKWGNNLQEPRERFEPAEQIKFIAGMVDILFDLSPSLRSARRAHILAVEAEEKATLTPETQPSENYIIDHTQVKISDIA